MAKPYYKRIFTIIVCILILTIVITSIQSYRIRTKYPKIIWIFWDSDKLPKIIQQIKDYNKNKLKGWDVRFMNLNTVRDYIPDSVYPANYKDLVPANKSDWMRLYLLNKYGGCWLDAGIIINDTTILDKIYNESVATSSDLTAFKSSSKNFTHKTGIEIPLIIDSWFLLAPVGSQIIQVWLDEITYAIDIGLLHYKRKVIKEGTDISRIQFKDENDTYLTVHICIEHILQKKLETVPRMLLLSSKDSMFKIQNECNWDNDCISHRMNNDPDSKSLPYIKLISKNRTMNLDKFFSN